MKMKTDYNTKNYMAFSLHNYSASLSQKQRSQEKEIQPPLKLGLVKFCCDMEAC